MYFREPAICQLLEKVVKMRFYRTKTIIVEISCAWSRPNILKKNFKVQIERNSDSLKGIQTE